MISEQLFSILNDNSIAYKTDVSLREHSTFRIGGEGELGIFPASAGELSVALKACKSENIPFRIIGKGSNLLFSDGLTQGAFIFTERMTGISVSKGLITAEAGVSLASLSSKAAEKSSPNIFV